MVNVRISYVVLKNRLLKNIVYNAIIRKKRLILLVHKPSIYQRL